MRYKTLLTLTVLSLALCVYGENVKYKGREYPYEIHIVRLTDGRMEVIRSFHDGEGVQQRIMETYVSSEGKIVKGKRFIWNEEQRKWIGIKE